jgi:hypothetical protein
MEKGSLIHAFLLGGGKLEIIDADSFRTKDARAQRDAARVEGKIPIVKSKADEYASIAQDLNERIRTVCGIDLGEYETEVRMEWLEPTFGGPGVLCHGVIDAIPPSITTPIDLKVLVTGRATREVCARALLHSHGILQAEAYKRALEQARPELMGRVEVKFLFVEMTAPFDCRFSHLSGELQTIAAVRWARAVDLWGKCLQTDHWPGFADEGLTRLDAPGWLLAQEMAIEEE